ncbi:MAG TPA: hypothetical protein VD789_04470 [Thermomicrobiales bacterium]|nr:hypothetical protein [Thermomicrobiales bacterium]
MGSRPPRPQSLPRAPRQDPTTPESEELGLSMDSLTPFIGFAIFPIALGAAFIGYAASGSSNAIAAALVITVAFAIAIWALVRRQVTWRQNARMSNELLAAILVAVIGFMMLIGGIAALDPVWMIVGVAILAAAWFIQRYASPPAP